jgi:CheY-like chemotaxis protein
VDVGTTFTIFLPASQKEIQRAQDLEEYPLLGKGKILVMDDEEVIRDVVSEMLTHIGYEASLTSDGAEAIEVYQNAKEAGEPFDAVIMDLTIPGGMGGKDAIKGLLKIDPEVKAIVSSGYSNDPIMSDFRQYGFSGVVVKPFKVQDLSRTLREVLVGTNN